MYFAKKQTTTLLFNRDCAALSAVFILLELFHSKVFTRRFAKETLEVLIIGLRLGEASIGN